MSDEVSGPLTIAFSVFEYSLTGLIGMFDSRVSLCANDQNMRDVLVDAFGKAEIHLGNLTMRPGHHVQQIVPLSGLCCVATNSIPAKKANVLRLEAEPIHII